MRIKRINLPLPKDSKQQSNLKDAKTAKDKSIRTGKAHGSKLNTETHLYMEVKWNDVENDSV